jgi:ribonuclease P protein component
MKNADFSFPKSRRLRNKEEYDRVFRESGRRSGSGLTVRIKPNRAECSRLGLMIGKKAGNAVTRNRIRRVLRETFRVSQHTFIEASDIVVTVYGSMQHVNNEDIRDIFMRLLAHKMSH